MSQVQRKHRNYKESNNTKKNGNVNNDVHLKETMKGNIKNLPV